MDEIAFKLYEVPDVVPNVQPRRIVNARKKLVRFSRTKVEPKPKTPKKSKAPLAPKPVARKKSTPQLPKSTKKIDLSKVRKKKLPDFEENPREVKHSDRQGKKLPVLKPAKFNKFDHFKALWDWKSDLGGRMNSCAFDAYFTIALLTSGWKLHPVVQATIDQIDWTKNHVLEDSRMLNHFLDSTNDPNYKSCFNFEFGSRTLHEYQKVTGLFELFDRGNAGHFNGFREQVFKSNTPLRLMIFGNENGWKIKKEFEPMQVVDMDGYNYIGSIVRLTSNHFVAFAYRTVENEGDGYWGQGLTGGLWMHDPLPNRFKKNTLRKVGYVGTLDLAKVLQSLCHNRGCKITEVINIYAHI